MNSLLLPLSALTIGCGGPSEPATPAEPTAPAEWLGRCVYTNPFSRSDECKEYVGDGWVAAEAEADCASPVPGGAPGLFEPGVTCERDAFVGECRVDGGGPLETVTVFWGDDPDSCAGAELGCGFSGGEFVPSDVCSTESGGVPPESAFVPFERVCVEPIAGEPPGSGPEGQVCTWEAISASTEPGRRYADYASCEPVFRQRPYYPYTVTADTAPDDPRLSDPAWLAEFGWVTAQVESSACVCCHSGLAPDGASGWTLEAEPIWLDTVDDDGLAMLAGWVDSTAFGAFEPEDNNGFDRWTTGLPTSDVSRMVAFLEGELGRRGLGREDFASTPPFGGVLYDQLFYEPQACEGGEGIAADGTITWTGGPARYVYVLEADSQSPGVPPNLDLPVGTVWRLDVDPTADPIPSGLRYGEAPVGSWVAFPQDGPAPALTSGATYYLHVLLDVYQPATRCLFTAP
ncbi:MAG: proteinase inhibitor [Myxococcota bacterium]